MLGLVEVLLGDEHTLAEEVLVDRLAVGLGNQPGRICQLIVLVSLIILRYLLTFWQRCTVG